MAGCAQDRGRTGGAGNYEALGPEVAIASHRRQMNVVLRLGAAGRSAALLARVTRESWVTVGLRLGAYAIVEASNTIVAFD